MSSATFSEVLRNLDPISHNELDAAHNILISQGLARFSDAGKYVDEFGVRHHHRELLQGVQLLLGIRRHAGQGLSATDYEILIRIAGTAVDQHAAKKFWNVMVGDDLRDARTSRTWNEFIKARFMTEDSYYQFDRSRVAVMARDLYRNLAPMPMQSLKKLERMRLALNANMQQPFNRRRDEPEEDIRRLMRHRRDYRGYNSHWIRAQFYGHEMNEDLLCTSLKAFARSSSLTAIKDLILKPYYNIEIADGEVEGTYAISGSRNFPPHHPLRPTTALLDAIIDSLGAISHVSLATQLVQHLSQVYSIPITHATWSNLLNWTYLNASAPFSTMRKAAGDYSSTAVSSADVLATWDAMAAANITPSIDDYHIYLKALIVQRATPKALAILREHLIPHHDTLTAAHDAALADEVLQAAASPEPVPLASRRRARAALLKDEAHYRIATALAALLQSISAQRTSRHAAQTTVPHLVAEFDRFLPKRVRYRVAQGTVELDRPWAEEFKIDHWRQRVRATKPAKLAGFHARGEGSDQPDFAYPVAPSMKVLEWEPVPRKRMGPVTRPEHNADWWKALEEEAYA